MRAIRSNTHLTHSVSNVIHEFKQILWVNTPHGIGMALFVIDYGPHENTVWCVALEKDGQILHYTSNQIRLTRNATFDLNLKDE